MQPPTLATLRQAVDAFLADELEKEVRRKVADLKKATEEVVAKKRQELAPQYETEPFLARVADSLAFMRGQQLFLATHTAKGIHSGLKTDNVVCSDADAGLERVTTGTLRAPHIDATSNNPGSHAGHLKNIVDFLNIPVGAGRLHQLARNREPAVRELLASRGDKDAELGRFLEDRLNAPADTPISDGRAKQLLFPIGPDDYHCLIPLYPASLAHHVFQEVQNIRYSEESKRAKRSRDKESLEECRPYRTVLPLGIINLGGANAQNVSRLNSVQGGRHFLLPSLPPTFTSSSEFRLRPDQDTFFNRRLAWHCKDELEALFAVVRDPRNIVELREQRDRALAEMLDTIVRLAIGVQQESPAGWTRECRLPYEERLWLDPERAELEGEEAFAQDRARGAWRDRVIDNFAHWLNGLLRKEFEKIRFAFGDAVFREWSAVMEGALREATRDGKEVFV